MGKKWKVIYGVDEIEFGLGFFVEIDPDNVTRNVVCFTIETFEPEDEDIRDTEQLAEEIYLHYHQHVSYIGDDPNYYDEINEIQRRIIKAMTG